MPTGSLCAERNAIGSALSMYPRLKRTDIKMVAVLGVPPLAADEAGLPRVQSLSSFVVEEADSRGGSRKPSLGSESEAGGEWAVLKNDADGNATKTVQTSNNNTAGTTSNSLPGSDDATEADSAAPVRRIMLYAKGASATTKARRTVVVEGSSGDINPLKPCGACNEWLKKISVSNPYFRIITFTDANCNGVYCQPCQD